MSTEIVLQHQRFSDAGAKTLILQNSEWTAIKDLAARHGYQTAAKDLTPRACILFARALRKALSGAPTPAPAKANQFVDDLTEARKFIFKGSKPAQAKTEEPTAETLDDEFAKRVWVVIDFAELDGGLGIVVNGRFPSSRRAATVR